jgi:two-component system cell cycle sensor histidine kinase/response regulator CckA
MSKILIVDDNPTNRSFLVTLLGYRGHSLREASDGAEALALVSAERPDLVIADILMPTMDGYEFVRRLRAAADIGSTPVIFCTAHFRERDARDLARECGVAHVLTKPCEPETVLLAVDACLGNSAPAPSVAESFDREHLRLLTDTLSEQTAEFKAVNLRLEALIEVALQLASESQQDCLLEKFCQSARSLMSARYAVVGIAPENGQCLDCLYTSGVDLEIYPCLKNPHASHDAVARLMEGRQPVRMRNPEGSPDTLGFPPDFPPFGSLLAAPIVSLHRSYGWLCLLHRLGAVEFSAEDERLAGILAALVGRIYESGKMSAAAQRHAAELEQQIAERKRAEEDLRHSEGIYRLFFEGNPLPGWLYHPESLRFLAVNEAAIGHYGYTRDEFLSMTMKDVQSAGDVPGKLKKVSAAASGADESDRWRHRKKDGSIIDVAIVSHSLADSRLARFVLVHDITEQLRVESAAREASERLDLALRASRTGVWTWYVATGRVVWDAYTYEIFGVPPGSFGGTFGGLLNLVHPEDRDRLSTEVRQVSQGHPEFAVEFRVIWPDGSVHCVDGRGQAFYGEARQLVRLTALTRDITEAKQAEEALRRSEASLSLAQSMGHLGNWEEDLATGELVWSAETFRIFGLDQAHAQPSRQSFFERVHPEDRGLVEVNVAAAVAGVHAYDCEHRIVRPNGDVRLVHELAKRVLDSSGAPIRIVGTVQDITDHRSLEDQLRQAQKMEAIGRLAGGVAHDFNNLLGVITGYCDLLSKNSQLTETIRKGLSQIRKASDRAVDLTKQLLAFSRRQIIQPQILDLNGVVGGVEGMLRRLIGEDVELQVVRFPELWSVNVDAGQMDQVLMNLAVNARDAMPEGGRITIETANIEWHGGQVEHRDVPPGPYVTMALSDTGSGMDDEIRSHIFEPFFTTKEQGKGTGLGLSTVYGIVRQSDGHIWVYSEVGVGTTFKIYLPALREARPVVQAEAVSGPPVQRTGTVLVVEDQDLFREMIQNVMEQSGYRILVAQSGDEALRICAEQGNSIDLVLTDVVMPKMSGTMLAEQVVALYPRMKVLFMSGYADDAIVRHGILSPQTEFLQKPFTAHSLLHKVQAVLDS